MKTQWVQLGGEEGSRCKGIEVGECVVGLESSKVGGVEWGRGRKAVGGEVWQPGCRWEVTVGSLGFSLEGNESQGRALSRG